MRYMLMFWEDESSADGGAASLTAIRSWVDEMTDTVEVRPVEDFPGDE